RRLATMGNRIRALDATRGSAMLFVLISHFGLTYFGRNGAEHLEDWFERVGKVASPTFMVLSGMMAGFLYAMRPDSFRATRLRLADRGLFFLTFGHVVIALAHEPRLGRLDWALYEVFITDTIAFCIIVGPLLVEALRPRTRLMLGAALFVASWVVMQLWPVAWHAWWRAAIVGELTPGPTYRANIYTFPVLPWFAVYLASTSLGTAFAARLKREGQVGAARLIHRIGGAAVLLGLVGAKLGAMAREAGAIDPEGLAATLLSLSCKRPPGPVYLVFHAGVGLLLLAATMAVDRLGRLDGWLRITTRMGRTSFFLFVVQFFVFNELFFRAQLPMTPLWPLYFAATIALVVLASWWWDRGGYNRFMTMQILRGRTSADERAPTGAGRSRGS
ncbi:MAG TPA: heparan-alpha-glucosaminide N-acetyltransferase domain-containing protein, partial [Kofleriaceae bacterium]